MLVSKLDLYLLTIIIVGNMKIHKVDIDGKSGDKRTKPTDKISRLL
jgi:hypothetical protein